MSFKTFSDTYRVGELPRCTAGPSVTVPDSPAAPNFTTRREQGRDSLQAEHRLLPRVMGASTGKGHAADTNKWLSFRQTSGNKKQSR